MSYAHEDYFVLKDMLDGLKHQLKNCDNPETKKEIEEQIKSIKIKLANRRKLIGFNKYDSDKIPKSFITRRN